MSDKRSLTSNAITLVIGASTLVSAFVLFVHLAFLGNIEEGTDLSALFARGTLLAGLVCLTVLIIITVKGVSCRWCLYYLMCFSIYISAMIGYTSLGDFTNALKTRQILPWISNNARDLIYTSMPVVFLVWLFWIKGRSRNKQ